MVPKGLVRGDEHLKSGMLPPGGGVVVARLVGEVQSFLGLCLKNAAQEKRGLIKLRKKLGVDSEQL